MAKLLAVPSGLLGGGWSIGVIAALQYAAPERHRATTSALSLLVMSMFGNMLGPWITGEVSTAIGSGSAYGLRLGLTLVIPTGLLGAWLIWRSAKTLEADRALLMRETA